ncbi:hypothetical protein HD806DRAFT_542639 [Xylariaceae sp. AK1471]|nr:hypothetical protein HD806DRAFT_542639 [Xylariaceae sp. AK1471]
MTPIILTLKRFSKILPMTCPLSQALQPLHLCTIHYFIKTGIDYTTEHTMTKTSPELKVNSPIHRHHVAVDGLLAPRPINPSVERYQDMPQPITEVNSSTGYRREAGEGSLASRPTYPPMERDLYVPQPSTRGNSSIFDDLRDSSDRLYDQYISRQTSIPQYPSAQGVDDRFEQVVNPNEGFYNRYPQATNGIQQSSIYPDPVLRAPYSRTVSDDMSGYPRSGYTTIVPDGASHLSRGAETGGSSTEWHSTIREPLPSIKPFKPRWQHGHQELPPWWYHSGRYNGRHSEERSRRNLLCAALEDPFVGPSRTQVSGSRISQGQKQDQGLPPGYPERRYIPPRGGQRSRGGWRDIVLNKPVTRTSQAQGQGSESHVPQRQHCHQGLPRGGPQCRYGPQRGGQRTQAFRRYTDLIHPVSEISEVDANSNIHDDEDVLGD